MIKNILFDMGGVLLDFDPNKFVARLDLNAADSEILIREVFHSWEWVALDRGSMSEEDALDAMCARIPERLHAAARDVFEHWDEQRAPYPGSYELAEELSRKGYNLCLLSNAGVRHARYWPKLPVSEFFGERLMVSYQWKLLKPEAAFYEKAFELLHLDRSECVFIDDNSVNVEAAQRLGLESIVYHGDAQLLRERLREKGVNI